MHTRGKIMQRCDWPACPKTALFGAYITEGSSKRWGHWCDEHWQQVCHDNIRRFKTRVLPETVYSIIGKMTGGPKEVAGMREQRHGQS